MEINTASFGEQMELVTITEPKFKTVSLMCMLLFPVIPERNAAYALAASLLTNSCRKYPDYAAMTVKLDTMYGASLTSSMSINGNAMQIVLNGSTIASRYALAGEDLSSDLTQLMCDCILDPNARDGAFNETAFRIEHKDLLDAIQTEINDKRTYALVRARRIAYEGESVAYPVHGTKEDVEKLTKENVYEAYKEILRRAVYRFYYVGPDTPVGLAEQFRTAFKDVERCPEPLQFFVPSPIKETPAEVTEPMDVTQSKLVMVFKVKERNMEAFRLFSALFGGTPFSLLFTNVREKESLCYYCASHIIAGKLSLVVESGVELANAERTKEAVLEQLAALQRGELSDELLENARLAMIDSLRSYGDTPIFCIRAQLEKFYTGDPADIEERIQRYLALTKEQIVEVANALKLDTVYLMQQGGAAE
ncbi:MAG: insulinase family protein [Oscillospiraceae bacterium]|nr:insulinase family protein [Oscillospiraceae bacterium]